jgi:serine/threonine protein kinase/tetratricopeptide (TPR) repeat protein
MSLAEYPTSNGTRDSDRLLEHLLHKFDAAWSEAANPPELEDFIAAAPLPTQDVQLRYVEELIKIDLEYRWRRRHAVDEEPWRLTDYAARLKLRQPFPSCELIGEEYWVRQLWGDRPSHAEYLATYPQHGELLRERLAQLDAELDMQVGQRSRRPSKNASPANCELNLRRDNGTNFPSHDTPIRVNASDTNPSGIPNTAAPVIPGYRILDVLDRGGMAVVYTARQLSLNRVVALKVIRGGEHAGPKELERFRAEVEAVASLRHPNIVQVFEAGEWNGMPYCAMELVSGGSLARKLNGNPLQAEAAAGLTVKLARALHAAHQAGIVHRDLKPANVLLEPTQHNDGLELHDELGISQRFEPKVADFGLAKRQGDSTLHTATGELLGTPSYMAPEQAFGSQAEIGPRTDVYALGVMLYEMLTGRPPFRASTSLETLRQVTHDEPVSLHRFQSAIPRDLETICFKCLEKSPNRRYASAAELAGDVERFLAGKPIHARRASSFECAVKWSRRNPAWAVAISIAALAAIGVLAGTIVHNRLLQVEIRRANESTAEAKRQKAQAIANFNKTQETLLGMLNQLWQESQLSGDEGHRELRENLLRAMLQYYVDVPLEHADSDPDLRLTGALVKFHAAHVHHYLGEYEQAAAQFRAVLPAFEELATADPGNSVYRRSWALCCFRLSGTLKLSGEMDQATQWLRKALEILGATSSDNVALRCLEARCRVDLARLYEIANELSEAINEAEKSAALWRSIVSTEPDNEEHRWNLCDTLTTLSRLVAKDRRFNEVEALVAESTAVAETWNGETASFYALHSRTGLADANRILAIGKMEQARNDEARLHFQAAIKLLDQVFEQSPDSVGARNVAHGVYWCRAMMHQSMALQQAALADWNRCVEMSDGEFRDIAVIQRARFRLDMNDVQQAAADADDLLADQELPPNVLFELAVIYSRCAENAASIKSLDSLERDAKSNEFAAQAVKCLEESRAAGFFADPKRIRDLQTVPALAVLRARADFQKLLDEVTVALND